MFSLKETYWKAFLIGRGGGEQRRGEREERGGGEKERKGGEKCTDKK